MIDHSDVGSSTPYYGKSDGKTVKFQVEELLPAKEAPLCLNDITILENNDFKAALEEDLKSLPKSPHIHETRLFENILIPYKYLRAKCYSLAIEAWEKLFNAIKDIDESRFLTMHKGTPYYFCGISAFLGNDYERAVFYFDAALQEDAHNYEELRKENASDSLAEHEKAPAALFLILDDSIRNQAAVELTKKTKKLLEDSLMKYRLSSRSSFDLPTLRNKFLMPSLEKEKSVWRSAATTLLSYLLESEVRSNEYSLRSKHGGTMEPFFLHLFKGCLLFETILKVSPECKSEQITLGRILLKDSIIFKLLNLEDVYKKYMTNVTFDEALNLNAAWRNNLASFNDRVVWTAYGIRNTTGHKLTWETRLSGEVYRELSQDILFSIFLSIDKCF